MAQQPVLEHGWLRCIEALQRSVYRIPISNLDDLKDRMRTYWENLDQ